MADDRKYKQRGYMDTNGDRGDDRGRERRPRGPRLPLDVTGPRLPRMVQAVAAARCHNCAKQLPHTVEFEGLCPFCETPLHCCKQCAHFEPSLRFQCAKPIKQRVGSKDKANDCEHFKSLVTVARDAVAPSSGPSAPAQPSTSPKDARAAFDNLFKK